MVLLERTKRGTAYCEKLLNMASESLNSGNSADSMKTGVMEAGAAEGGAAEGGPVEAEAVWSRLDDEVVEEETPAIYSKPFGKYSIMNLFYIIISTIYNNFL